MFVISEMEGIIEETNQYNYAIDKLILGIKGEGKEDNNIITGISKF